MFYSECPICGASLDPGEKCDCAEKKEACTAATEQTPSALLNATKPQKNYITEQEGCQDDTSGNSSNGEIRKQICQTGLPVYLL